MTHGHAQRVEIAIDAGASMLLAGAVAYALAQLSSGVGLDVSVTALSFLGCFYGLRTVPAGEEAFALPEVALVEPYEAEDDVLELTEADRWHNETADDGELLLDRELTHIGPGSRVVRLFEPSAMPTTGELKARIDRHLVEFPQSTPPDASQDLYDALAQLRRSLH